MRNYLLKHRNEETIIFIFLSFALHFLIEYWKSFVVISFIIHIQILQKHTNRKVLSIIKIRWSSHLLNKIKTSFIIVQNNGRYILCYVSIGWVAGRVNNGGDWYISEEVLNNIEKQYCTIILQGTWHKSMPFWKYE